MFNSPAHRQAVFLMPVLLCGIWIGHVGLSESQPAAGKSEPVSKPPNTSPYKLQNAQVSNGAQSPDMDGAGSDKSAGNNSPEPEKKTAARTQMRAAGPQSAPLSSREDAPTPCLWQAPLQTEGGDIVIPLAVAGVPEADSQNPAENILGMIVQAN